MRGFFLLLTIETQQYNIDSIALFLSYYFIITFRIIIIINVNTIIMIIYRYIQRSDYDVYYCYTILFNGHRLFFILNIFLNLFEFVVLTCFIVFKYLSKNTGKLKTRVYLVLCQLGYVL